MVGVLLGLALIALVLALVELSGDAEKVTEVPQTATPVPTASPATPQEGAATPPPGEEGEATPQPSAEPESTPTAPPTDLAEWPEGRTAWTVILNSSGTREDAERLGNELAVKGVPNVGVLDSNDFDGLGPDSFIVFSGQYENREQADEALGQIRAQAGAGSTRRIVPADDAKGEQDQQQQQPDSQG